MNPRNIELLIVMGACLVVTAFVCNEFGPDELVKSGAMVLVAGFPLAAYRAWQNRQEKSE